MRAVIRLLAPVALSPFLLWGLIVGPSLASEEGSYEGRVQDVKVIKCGLPPAECEGSLLLDVAGRPVTIALKLGPKELVRGQETIGLPMIRPGDVVTVRYVRQGDELVARSVRVHPR